METSIILEIFKSKEYKSFHAANLKNVGAHLYRYKNGRFTSLKIEQPTRSRGRVAKAKDYILKESKVWAVEAMVSNGIELNDSFKLMKCFNALVKKDGNTSGIRYSVGLDGAFKNISEELRNEFFTPYVYDEKEIGWVANSSNRLGKILNNYIDSKDFAPVELDKNRFKRYYTMSKKNFKLLPIGDKMRVLKYTATVMDDKIYIYKYAKTDLGNLGRKYETIFEFPKTVRNHFNIYGWDLEAALQNIWYQDCKKISPYKEFPITLELITNKTKFRKTIAEYVFADFAGKKALGKAKTFITKIYQGYRSFKGLNEAGIYWLKQIAEEADVMMEMMITDAMLDVKSERTKFAILKTDKKMIKKAIDGDESAWFNKDDGKFLNSKNVNEAKKSSQWTYNKTMIYNLWTYTEQRIMKVIESRIRNPIDLLDARYTQSKNEFTELSKIDWSELIKEETGYSMKIGKEIYEK